MRAPANKDASTIRHALRGLLSLDSLPFGIRAIVEREQRKRVRQGNREVRRLLKANQYRAVALAGGGTREVARRARQMLKGAV